MPGLIALLELYPLTRARFLYRQESISFPKRFQTRIATKILFNIITKTGIENQANTIPTPTHLLPYSYSSPSQVLKM